MDERQRVIVVGGGAAGMMAAIASATAGAPTVLLEKTDRLGFKIRISGGGRCNVTNATSEPRELVAMVPGNGRFLMDAFRRFGQAELLELLARHGVKTRIEPPFGKIFPLSDRSNDVVRALEAEMARLGVVVHLNTPVSRLVVEDDRVVGLVAADHREWKARAIVVAVGGQSLSRSGSTGDGYRFAREVGHTVTPLFPSLVPLRVSGTTELAGVALADVEGGIWVAGKPSERRFRGDLLFTHTGLSGPVVLQLSRAATAGLSRQASVELRLDLYPDRSFDELDALLVERLAASPRSLAPALLKEDWPRAVVPRLLEAAGVAPARKISELSRQDRRRLVETLRSWRFAVTGYHSFDAAEVTAGGVDVREVEPRTMASRLLAGLYWAGEVLDVDGYVGGYNFQVAWSSGHVAGSAAAACLEVEAEPQETESALNK